MLSTGKRSGRSWDHPGGGEGGVSKIALGHFMLGLPMGCHEHRRKVCVSLGAADPLLEPFLVGVELPRHSEAVGLPRGATKHETRMTSHTHCLGQIGAEAHA